MRWAESFPPVGKTSMTEYAERTDPAAVIHPAHLCARNEPILNVCRRDPTALPNDRLSYERETASCLPTLPEH